MRIVCLSDTHGLHSSMNVPDADVLIHAGDLTRFGNLEDIQHFSVWLDGLPHRHKLVIAGNHDRLFESNPHIAELSLGNVTYLRDSGVTIDGVRFYGSPWQPEFYNWAFNLPRGKALAEKWDDIPSDTDILITHGPPAGILDRTKDGNQAGCEDLLKRIRELNLKLHVFGHIHEGYGQEKKGNTLFVNAAMCDRLYKAVNFPVVVDL